MLLWNIRVFGVLEDNIKKIYLKFDDVYCGYAEITISGGR
jgi:hypothetical protein